MLLQKMVRLTFMEVQNTYFSYFISTLLLLNNGQINDNTFAPYSSFTGYEASGFLMAEQEPISSVGDTITDDFEATDSLFTFPIQINFQDENTIPPSGYEKDYGEPYGLKSLSGLTY